MTDQGPAMHALCRELWPICRSITGAGFRQSLAILARDLPGLAVTEVASGTRCFDWTVPPEWNIRDAQVIGPDGDKVIDFQQSNLHVVGYSIPVDRTLSLAELQQHLHSLPEQPDAIPYVTSYYQQRWGFCLSHNRRLQLREGRYRVRIDSDLKPGSLTYGELILPGATDQEVFLSTYLCHPSLANNELSGPVVTAFLARWLLAKADRRLSYRIIFIPETIGSITYLSRNLAAMQARIVAGFNVSCVGDDRAYSYLPSRRGDTLADRVACHVLKHLHPDHVRYSFLDRGSDERQYCSPGVDLPVCSLMRTKYGCYPEYHTSLDDLNLVTPSGLAGGYQVLKSAIECLEMNWTPMATVRGEPQLGKYGLYPTLSTKDTGAQVVDMLNLLAHADGTASLLDIAEIVGKPLWELSSLAERLAGAGLLRPVVPTRPAGDH